MSTTPYTIGIGLKEPRMRSARFCWGRGLLLLLLAVQLCVSWLRAEGGTAFTVDGNSQHTQVSPREQPWLSNLRASNNYDKCKFLAEGPLKGDWPSIPGFPGVVRSFPRWRQASLRRNAARVSQRVRSPSEFIFVSRDEGDERARAAEAPAGSGDTDEENGAEEDEEEFVPPTSDDLGPASEELAEALDKACSPSTEKELLESLGDAVGGGINAVDGWMSSLLGSVGAHERDYTLLEGYLLGKNSLLDVVKGNFLFLTSVATAAVLLLVFCLFCLPKLCCPCARHLCCCCRTCRSANFSTRLLQLLVSAAVGIMALIFLCLSISYTSQSLHGAKQLHCQVFKFADEILQGTPPSVEEARQRLLPRPQPKALLPASSSKDAVLSPPLEAPTLPTALLPSGDDPSAFHPEGGEREEGQNATEPDGDEGEVEDEGTLTPFVGLVPLLQETESLAHFVDPQNPQNLLVTAKEVAFEQIDVKPMQTASLNAAAEINSFCNEVTNLPLEKDLQHRVLWCLYAKEADYTEMLEKMKVSMECIVDTRDELIYPKLEGFFQDIKLPSLNIAESIPTESIYGLFSTASSMLSKTQEPVSKVLSLLRVGLNIDSAIAVALVLLGAAWTVWFFLLGTTARSPLPGALWSLLSIVAIIVLFFAGAIGWVATFGLQTCSMVVDEFLGNDNWNVLVKYAPVVEPLLQQCMYRQANGDMLQAVGLDTMFSETISSLKGTFDSLPTDSFNLDEETSKMASLLLQRSNEFGPLVALDSTKLSEERKKVFSEFLTSGLQLKDVKLPNSDTLYGLETLQSLVEPFQLKALQEDAQVQASLQWKALSKTHKAKASPETAVSSPDARASALSFVIDETNPKEDDPAFLEWLEKLQASKEKEFQTAGMPQQEAQTAAKEFVTFTKNGIWILQQKQKALGASFPCSAEEASTRRTEKPVSKSKTSFIQSRLLRQVKSRAARARRSADPSRVSSVCSFQQMFGIAPDEMSTSFFYRKQQEAASKFHAAQAELLDAVGRLEAVREGLNCRFLRRNVIQSSIVMCNHFVENLYKVGIYRSFGGGCTFLIAALIMLLWRIIKNSRDKGKGNTGGGDNA